MSNAAIKPTHRAIGAYHEALASLGGHGVGHEMGLRGAFQTLLAEAGRLRGWTLIPELSLRVRGKLIRPDGTLRDDQWQLPRGFWEAKDSADDLDEEVRKKAAKGYPLVNTIFEDTRRAVLFQHGHEALRADLADRQQVADLLNRFLDHTDRDIEGFEQAISEFRDRIPDLARGLLARIVAAHGANPRFQAAFEGMLALCKESLNPNISVAAVDEMLVQQA